MQRKKYAFITTLIIGIVVHAFRLVNYQATWDSLYNYYGVGATLTNGRWFLGTLGKLSSNYDLSLINGLISILALSVVAVLLVDLFDIGSKGFIVLLGALLVGFPTVVGCFTYMYTADCYMIAFMLAVLAVYCAAKWRYGLFLGAVCVCFSVGIYQAYTATAIVMCILVVLDRILFRKTDIKSLLLLCVRLILALGLGMVLYEVMLKICLHGMPLIGYMGIDTVGILRPEEYVDAVNVSWLDLQNFFNIKENYEWIEGETSLSHYWGAIYGRVNGLIFLLSIVMVFIQIIKEKIYKKPLQLLIVIAGVIILPFACLAVNFVTTVRGYHTLMMMALFFLYFMCMLCAYKAGGAKRKPRCVKLIAGVVTVGCCIIAYMNGLNANISYYRQQLAWEKSYAISLNVIDRIQEMPEYGPNFSVFVVGEYNSYAYLDRIYPSIIGVTEDSVLNDMYHYINMWHHFEASYAGTSSDYNQVIENLKNSEEFQSMPYYPAKGSIRYMDGKFVVKMPEK